MEQEVEQGRSPAETILRQVIDFACTNFNLDLSEDQMKHKIDSIKQGVNLERVKA